METSCCVGGKRGSRGGRSDGESERESVWTKSRRRGDREVRQRLGGRRETEGLDWGEGEISMGFGREE